MLLPYNRKKRLRMRSPMAIPIMLFLLCSGFGGVSRGNPLSDNGDILLAQAFAPSDATSSDKNYNMTPTVITPPSGSSNQKMKPTKRIHKDLKRAAPEKRKKIDIEKLLGENGRINVDMLRNCETGNIWFTIADYVTLERRMQENDSRMYDILISRNDRAQMLTADFICENNAKQRTAISQKMLDLIMESEREFASIRMEIAADDDARQRIEKNLALIVTLANELKGRDNFAEFMDRHFDGEYSHPPKHAVPREINSSLDSRVETKNPMQGQNGAPGNPIDKRPNPQIIDHGGEDVIISSNTVWSGIHINIGNFVVESGATLYVIGKGGKTSAKNIIIKGTVDGSGLGLPGSPGGMGGRGSRRSGGGGDDEPGESHILAAGGSGGSGGSGGTWLGSFSGDCDTSPGNGCYGQGLNCDYCSCWPDDGGSAGSDGGGTRGGVGGNDGTNSSGDQTTTCGCLFCIGDEHGYVCAGGGAGGGEGGNYGGYGGRSGSGASGWYYSGECTYGSGGSGNWPGSSYGSSSSYAILPGSGGGGGGGGGASWLSGGWGSSGGAGGNSYTFEGASYSLSGSVTMDGSTGGTGGSGSGGYEDTECCDVCTGYCMYYADGGGGAGAGGGAGGGILISSPNINITGCLYARGGAGGSGGPDGEGTVYAGQGGGGGGGRIKIFRGGTYSFGGCYSVTAGASGSSSGANGSFHLGWLSNVTVHPGTGGHYYFDGAYYSSTQTFYLIPGSNYDCHVNSCEGTYAADGYHGDWSGSGTSKTVNVSDVENSYDLYWDWEDCDDYDCTDCVCSGTQTCSRNGSCTGGSCNTSTYGCHCVIGSCGADCVNSGDCSDHCVGDTRYYSGSCSSCQCSYSTYNCNSDDGWYDTGATRWVDDPATECCQKEQKEQNYRDYYCSFGACTYNITGNHWIDTGAQQDIDSDCSADGWYFTDEYRWIDDPTTECCEKRQRKREDRNYYCSGCNCNYSVLSEDWVDTGEQQNVDSDCPTDADETVGAPYACCGDSPNEVCTSCQDWQTRHYYCSSCTCQSNITASWTVKGGCSPFDANAGTNDTICAGSSTTLNGSVSGGTGTYSYDWDYDGTGDWDDPANPNVSPAVTTVYVLEVRDDGAGGCLSTKDSITVTVFNDKPTGTWTGYADSDWTNPQNWGQCLLPDNSTNVVIPDAATTPTDPIVNTSDGTCCCRSITIQSSAILSNGTGKLFVYGDWTNNGSFVRNTGIISFEGGLTQTVSGSVQTNFHNLYLNKTGGKVDLNQNIGVANLQDMSATGESTIDLRTIGNYKIEYVP